MYLIKMRTLVNGALQARPLFTKFYLPKRRVGHHADEYPLPFDNLPFRVTNRYKTTVIFSLFFGTGLWAPFIILWYMMAKTSL